MHKRLQSNFPLLDPVQDMKITDKSFKSLTKKIALFEDRLKSLPLHSKDNLPGLLKDYERKDALRKNADRLRSDLKKAKSLLQMSELKCMKRVLRRLGYCTDADVIKVKGRIACELSR